MSKFFTADLHLDHERIILHTNRVPWCVLNPEFDPSRPADRTENTRYRLVENAAEEHSRWLVYFWNKLVKQKDEGYVLGDFAYRRHNHFLMALHGKKTLILGNHDEMSQKELQNFTKVCHYAVVRLKNGRKMVMQHYPLRSWEGAVHGWYSIYGHNHGRIPEYDWLLSCDVGVDVWGYLPVPEEVLIAKFQQRERFLQERHINRYVDDEDNEFSLYMPSKIPKWKRVNELRHQNMLLMQKFGYTEVYRGTPLEAVFKEYLPVQQAQPVQDPLPKTRD